MDGLNDISVLPAYLLAALLGWAIWADVRHDLCRLISGRNVVVLAIGVWYLLEATMLPEALRSFSQEQYDFGVFQVGLAFTCFLVGYHYTSGCLLFPALGEKITFFDDDKWLWRLVLIGAIIGFTPIVYLTGTKIGETFEGMMGQRATWGGTLGRGKYGNARAAFLMLEMFIGGVAPFAAILLLGRGSTVAQRLLCGLVVGWPILRAFGMGSRSPLITSLGCVLAICYWKAAPALRKKMIYGGLACTPLVYALMAAIAVSRGSGTFSWEERKKANYVGHEMFRELIFITSKIPAEMNYQYGYPYFVQLLNPIPRFLWEDKPKLGTGKINAVLHGTVNADGEEWVSISPGLIGEMHMNFGVVGIIALSAFGGWLVKGWDLIPRLHGHSLPIMMYYSAGLGVLFIMGLSFTMNMFYGLLSLAVLAWLFRFFNPHAVADGVAPAPVTHESG